MILAIAISKIVDMICFIDYHKIMTFSNAVLIADLIGRGTGE
jgi:hypothetical protein